MTDEQKSSGRSRKAVGPARPVYLDHGDVDKVMAVVLALTSEVASLRDRLDTHERLAPADGASHTRVEAYVADAATEESREAWRDAYIRRLFRVITEDIEALSEPPA